MKMLKKKSFRTISLLMFVTVMALALVIPHNVAQAALNFKDSFIHATASDYEKAFKIGDSLPDDDVKNTTHNPQKMDEFSGIGKVVRDSKGTSKSGGTGFVVSKHQIVTNQHVVSSMKGNQYPTDSFYFYPQMNKDDVPLKFHVKSIQTKSTRDIAVLTVDEDLTKYVKPLKIADNEKIKDMQPGEKAFMVGYPRAGGDNNGRLMIKSEGNYLRPTQDRVEHMSKMTRYSGNSGSPLMNKDNEVIGIHAHGIHPDVSAPSEKQQIYTGGPTLMGTNGVFVKSFIE